MGKFIKPGKVVIVLSGRYAGKKAIVVKAWDDGSKERKFGHVLVAGIERYPLPVVKSMSKKKIIKRSKVKPFVKFINFSHVLPTRYSVSDVDLKAVLQPTSMKKSDSRTEAKKAIKKLFEARYMKSKTTTGTQYFFQKLRF